MNDWNTPAGKPRLLLFPFEQLAHYLRCLTLAKQLEPYFDISVAYSQRYAPFVTAAGFETFSCAGFDADEVLACIKKFDFSWINSTHLEAVLKHQIDTIEKWQPAIVLGDTIPTLKMAAEKTGVPYVSLMNGYMSKYYAGVRTMSWRYPLYPYFKYLPKAILNPLTKIGEQRTFYQIHQPFKMLRQQYGLLKKFTYADELEGDLNLICDLPELFPQQLLPAHYQLTPPLIYQGAAETYGVLKKLDQNKRTLFVSMGSTGDWQQVSFLGEPPFQQYNIITAGDTTDAVQGPHVVALSFANVQHVFPKVDLVICHGGNGTIYQALQFGIPVLCKTAHFEQEWNVQAVEENGLGASLDKVTTTAQYLDLIEAWLNKKGRQPLRQMQQKLKATNGFENVVTHIQNLWPGATKTLYYEAGKKSA